MNFENISLETYTDENFPAELKAEVQIILRNEWPVNPKDKNIPRSWKITDHLVLITNDKVLSYAAVTRKSLTHNQINYDIVGLSGVITDAKERGKGYGRQVIQAATDIIKKSNSDLALFNTAQKGLYEKFGYEFLPNGKILKGDPNNPEIYPEDVFALFLSARSIANRSDFENIPIYFGQRIW